MAILGKDRWDDLEAIYEGITGMKEIYEADPESRGLNAYLKAFSIYVENVCRALDDGNPVVWYNLGMTPELIFGLENVHNIPIETYPALQDIVGDVDFTIGYIDRAEAHGLPPDVCSVDKAALGSVLKGIMPKADCLIGVNTPCDSQLAALQTIAEITGTPLFLIDIPYLYGEREIRYVSRQLSDAIAFLEHHTGRKFSWDRFAASCRKSNGMSEHLLEWNELRKIVPCPQVSKIICLMVPLFITFSGSETGVETASELATEARERARRGEAAVDGERIRAIWYQDPVWFDLQFYDWMESELKMVIPMDLFGFHAPEGVIEVQSREQMLDGLARRLVRVMPMARQFKGPIDFYLDDFATMWSEYRAHCAIFAGHVACKHGWGGIGILKERARELGAPLLVFEFDMFDPRVTPVEAIQEELSRFVNDIVLPRLDP